MQPLRESVAVSEQTCTVLANMAFENRDKKVITALAIGIPILLNILQRHMESVPVSTAVCRALFNFALHHSNRPLILQADGLYILQTCLQLHAGLLDVHRFGMFTLDALCQ